MWDELIQRASQIPRWLQGSERCTNDTAMNLQMKGLQIGSSLASSVRVCSNSSWWYRTGKQGMEDLSWGRTASAGVLPKTCGNLTQVTMRDATAAHESFTPTQELQLMVKWKTSAERKKPNGSTQTKHFKLINCKKKKKSSVIS